MTQLPEILYQLRTSKKLSQENLAEELGVDYTTYARYESGKTELKASQAKILAEFYGLTMDQFFNYGSAYNPKEPDSWNENHPQYIKRTGDAVSLIVELDGSKNTEKKWIELITGINRLIRKSKKK